jgi:hypothetical protein
VLDEDVFMEICHPIVKSIFLFHAIASRNSQMVNYNLQSQPMYSAGTLQSGKGCVLPAVTKWLRSRIYRENLAEEPSMTDKERHDNM